MTSRLMQSFIRRLFGADTVADDNHSDDSSEPPRESPSAEMSGTSRNVSYSANKPAPTQNRVQQSMAVDNPDRRPSLVGTGSPSNFWLDIERRVAASEQTINLFTQRNREDLDKRDVRLDDLQRKFSTLDGQLRENNDKLSFLNNQLTQKTSEITRLTNRITQTDEKLLGITQQQEDKIVKLEKQLAQLTNRISLMEQQYNELAPSHTQLKSEIEAAKQKFKSDQDSKRKEHMRAKESELAARLAEVSQGGAIEVFLCQEKGAQVAPILPYLEYELNKDSSGLKLFTLVQVSGDFAFSEESNDGRRPRPRTAILVYAYFVAGTRWVDRLDESFDRLQKQFDGVLLLALRADLQMEVTDFRSYEERFGGKLPIYHDILVYQKTAGQTYLLSIPVDTASSALQPLKDKVASNQRVLKAASQRLTGVHQDDIEKRRRAAADAERARREIAEQEKYRSQPDGCSVS